MKAMKAPSPVPHVALPDHVEIELRASQRPDNAPVRAMPVQFESDRSGSYVRLALPGRPPMRACLSTGLVSERRGPPHSVRWSPTALHLTETSRAACLGLSPADLHHAERAGDVATEALASLRALSPTTSSTTATPTTAPSRARRTRRTSIEAPNEGVARVVTVVDDAEYSTSLSRCEPVVDPPDRDENYQLALTGTTGRGTP